MIKPKCKYWNDNLNRCDASITIQALCEFSENNGRCKTGGHDENYLTWRLKL